MFEFSLAIIERYHVVPILQNVPYYEQSSDITRSIVNALLVKDDILTLVKTRQASFFTGAIRKRECRTELVNPSSKFNFNVKERTPVTPLIIIKHVIVLGQCNGITELLCNLLWETITLSRQLIEILIDEDDVYEISLI